jgi:glucokinase
MALLGIDLGGTKLAIALFTEEGKVISKNRINLEDRWGKEIGDLITSNIRSELSLQEKKGDPVRSVGICVPGIFNSSKGTVWAPNIPGWDDYPLRDEIIGIGLHIPVTIDSDRSCSLLGEVWQGNAKNCRNAVFIAVGTGIGAGIMCNGEIIRGSNDVAGATGWMALGRPFRDEYRECGFFEFHASGEGIGKVAREYLAKDRKYTGELRSPDEITSYEVFKAWKSGDALAVRVINECVEIWGMAAANIVSLFNPEKIIFGGGIFGPAIPLIPRIKEEAMKWAQPVSIKQASFEASALGGDAGVCGAAFLALLSM